MNQIKSNSSPEYLIFAQHGWDDNSRDISRLAQALIKNNNTLLTAPSLGKLKTWLRIEPLINEVEQIATETINNYPEIPIKIIGHSMGGLIWLEVLDRNRRWWQKVHSLVLIGSPIGGANVARIIDPLGIGIGIARDLGKNRRPIAEKIAQSIPTLTIAGELGFGSDGLVTVTTTKFDYCQFVTVSEIVHAALKCHPRLVPIIQDFWTNPQIQTSSKSHLATKLIKKLQSLPGMTDGHWRDFPRSQLYFRFPEGICLHTWKNTLGVDHVFVADRDGKCLYAGYVGWLHSEQLRQALIELQQEAK
jgi:pimeloyl-ACP methyl ester carboxylesterase